jgi:hypothetical protein
MPGASGLRLDFFGDLEKATLGPGGRDAAVATAGKDACRYMNRRLRFGFQLFWGCRYALGIAGGRGKLSLDQTIDHYPYEIFL